MGDLAPFRAWRYDFGRVGAPESVLAPPYDVISHDEARRMAATGPHHVIHLILGKPPAGGSFGDADYAEAARCWREWREAGALVHDAEPALYLYDCEFDDLVTGERVLRKGILGALALSPFEAGDVLPHEEIFAGPLADRSRLLEATDAAFSAILALADDADDAARQALEVGAPEPVFSCTDAQGVVHRVARVTEPGALAAAREALSRRPFVIADGHHRYTASLAHAARRGRAGARCLACVINAHDPGVRAYGTHRLLSFGGAAPDLAPLSRVAEVTRLADDGQALATHRQIAPRDCAFVFVTREGASLVSVTDPERALTHVSDLHPALRTLPLAVLHRGLLEGCLQTGSGDIDAAGGISHTRDAEHAIASVREGRFDLAVLVHSPALDQLFEVCAAGARMPHKSTFFHPKLLSGAALLDLAE